MTEDPFDLVEQAVQSSGPASALDLLAQQFLAGKKYPQLFEARLMQKRLELGLPLIQLDATPDDQRGAYQQAMVQAAREVGSLLLAEGDIVRAWPYLRAIGDREPVVAAIEKLRPGQPADGVVDIALGERVHPRKGLELLIAQDGICRAITYCEQYPDLEPREDCLALLVRTLHRELVASLQHAIEQREGLAPPAQSIPELIAGREWLFGEFDAYVDTSHVASVIRFALDLQDEDAIRLALELCEYGAHLSPQFKLRGQPPFEDLYLDHAVFLRALLGQNVDHAIAHFRGKIAPDNPSAAQPLVTLLVRLHRYRDALDVSLEYVKDGPTVLQLCQLAGDSERLKTLARERGDLLSFAAGAVQAAEPPILPR
jgi:hypothetical protein